MTSSLTTATYTVKEQGFFTYTFLLRIGSDAGQKQNYGKKYAFHNFIRIEGQIFNDSDIAADPMNTESFPGALSWRRLQLSRLRPANDYLNVEDKAASFFCLAPQTRPFHFARNLLRLPRLQLPRRTRNQIGSRAPIKQV